MKIKLILFYICFVAGCKTNDTSIIDKEELENYLQTSEVVTKTRNRDLNISVSNSKLVEENSRKKGTKWTTDEAYASISALIAFSNLDRTQDIDNIFIDFTEKGRHEFYRYKIVDLKQINTFVTIGRDFLMRWSNHDYLNASYLLDQAIFNYRNVDTFERAFKPILSTNKLNKSEIIAFKISNGSAALYINGYYVNNTAITYIFNFRLNSNGKIAGIGFP